MQSFLDALKTAPESSRAKVNIFLTSFNPNARKIGIFLEGRDDPSLIRVNVRKIADETNLPITTTVLGRKKDVIEAWKYLEQRFPCNPRLLFFVDKDHDDLINVSEGHITQNNLFVTKSYSIENYLVSADAIEVILTDIWNIDSSSAIEIARHNFSEFQQSYRSAFLPWMAWMIVARRSGKELRNNNISSSILKLNDRYEPILNWEPDMSTHLTQKCNIIASPDAVDIASTESELEKLPTKCWLRGKQELWCLLAFINKLEQDIKDDKSVKSVKTRSQINISNAIELLAPRLPCPKDLEGFLRTHLKNL